jgi:hypothetical protein
MSSSSRRGFIALSATGLAAAAAAPSAFAADSAAEPADNGDTGAAGSGPVVAYVHDAAHGQVSVMRGEHEVVVHDPALVRTLTKHAGR